MPHWSNQLPANRKHMGFELRRTPAVGNLHVIVTSPDVTVCDTHFYHGRTIPCERPDCPACNEAIPYRTHVYLAAYDPRKAEHFILETTAHAAIPLIEYRDANDTLRGCAIYASRPKGAKNSRVEIQTNSTNLSKINLPSPPDVPKALCVIWRLPTDAATPNNSTSNPPTIQIDSAITAKVHQQPDNANGYIRRQQLQQQLTEACSRTPTA